MAWVNFPDSIKADILLLFRDRIDAGPTAGTMTIYDGTPGGPGKALGTLTLSRPCAELVNGTLVFAPITESVPSKTESGTATWARLASADGKAVIETDVSDKAGNGRIKLNTTDIKAGGPIQCSGLVLKF